MHCTKCEVSDDRPTGRGAPALLLGLLAAGTLGLTACAPAPLSPASLTTGSSTSAATGGTTGSPSTGPTPDPSGSPTSAPPGPQVTTLPPSSGPTPATTSPTPGPQTTTPAPSPAPTPTSSTAVDADGHVETAFATAAGGIVCAVSADGPQARCDLDSSTWKPPPAPADCHGAWGAGLSLTPRGAELTCTTDTVLADAASGGAGTWWEGLPPARLVARGDGRQEVTLVPGATVVAGSGASRLTCSATATTVSCSAGTARFSVSKTAYSLR